MADKDISLAKITRPRVSGVVQRERLMQLLDSGRDRPVLWISGPAGAGKTTLAASYLDSRGISCLWYQMDESDSDASSFFYYLGLAAKKTSPRRKKPLPLLTLEYLPAIPTFAKRYFESLFQRLKRPCALVFDNYQDLPADSMVHEVIVQGLSVMPPDAHVIISSRTEPVPSFARLAAGGSLTVLTADDLQFTEKESREFISLSGNKGATDAAVADIHARTQGWAAGLVLFREMAGTRGPEPGFTGSRTPEEIFHYFAGELFDRSDIETRQFLLKTAIMREFTAPMAENISGMRNAGRILNELTRKNYFILQRPEQQPIYQYHPLFHEFLLLRLEEQSSREALKELREKIAALLEQSGRIEDAVELLRETGNWQDVARLVLSSAQHLFVQGRTRTLEQWLSSVPRDIIERTPWLLYWAGVCLIPFQPTKARRRLEQALALFRDGDDGNGMYLALSGIIDTCLHESDDFSVLDRWIAVIEPLLKRGHADAAPEIGARLIGGMFAALVLRQPHHPDFVLWEERASELLAGDLDTHLRVQIGFHLSVHTLWSGNFKKMGIVVDLLRKIEESEKLTPLMHLSVVLSQAMHDWIALGDHERCVQRVEEALAFAGETGVHLWDLHLLGHGASAALSAGNTEPARRLLQRMAPGAEPLRRIDAAYYHQLQAWFALLTGDASAAAAHHAELRKYRRSLGLPFAEALCDVDSAHVMHLLGEHKQASVYLDDARTSGVAIRSKLILFMVHIAEAFMAFDLGSENAGLAALRKALALGREEGYVNSHLWRPDVMSRLCIKALEAGIETDYVRGLIGKRRLVPDPMPLEIVDWPWQYGVNTLGGFELLVDGKPLAFSGKARKKPIDLLKAIIVFNGKDVAEHQLSEALWPDAEGDLARRSFDTTLHRLRKLLGNDKAVRIDEGKLSLDPRLWRVDVWVFERLFARAEETARNIGQTAASRTVKKGSGARAEATALLEKAVNRYKGHFLLSDGDQPWTVSLREKLKTKFLRLIVMAGKYHEQLGEWDQAKKYFQKGLDVDNLVEEFYQHLMLCCIQLGQKSEAVSVYQRCRTILKAAIGVEPSLQTVEIYSAIMNKS